METRPTDNTTKPIRGRGTGDNPPNRFVPLHVISDPDALVEDQPSPRTEFFKDSTRTIIARNDSPDIPFEFSLNPYRGCEHGCIYCFARCFHEFLGFSAGLDFESKIIVKHDAPELLRKELSKPSYKPACISMGTGTDPYQPVERKLKLVRRLLEVFAEFRNPVTIVTKNHLVTRDIDILSNMARDNLVAVLVSVTTLDPEITRIMEPRTSTPSRRLDAISQLSQAGIPAGVMVSPIIPGLTDHEILPILHAAAKAGARWAGHQIVRLPGAVAGLFEQWLTQHMPARKDKILNRIRSIRCGHLNNPQFSQRMHTTGPFAEQIDTMFEMGCRKAGINTDWPALSTSHFRRVDRGQLRLF